MQSYTFDNQIAKLREALGKGLPGPSAHSKMAPAHRDRLIGFTKGQAFARKSAVLILLFPDEAGKMNTTFIKRMEYEGVHSGQIAFPGGKHEDTDTDIIATALREAEEEVGLIKDSIIITGRLSDLFVPPSNFIISPVIAQIPFRPEFIPDDTEVAEIFTVPLDYLCDPVNSGEFDIIVHSGQTIRVPGYSFKEHLIWGATAMILSELLQLVSDNGIIEEK
ncbi:MAG: CoA pyrophosphatase [Bacteroidota bacterium]